MDIRTLYSHVHRKYSISWDLQTIPKYASKFWTLIFLSLRSKWSPPSSSSVLMFWVWNAKHNTLLHIFRSKLSLLVLGPSKYLSIMHSSDLLLNSTLGFVKNTAFFGSTSTNPFHFHHYDMMCLVLYVNGVQYPSEPLTMDCSSPYGVTIAYETLLSSTGIHHDDRAHMITLEMFTRVFYLLSFDLTPDREPDEERISLSRQRNVHIDSRFKTYYRNM